MMNLQEACDENKSHTIVIPTGTYSEDLTIPDKFAFYGESYDTTLTGRLTCLGSFVMDGLTFSGTLTAPKEEKVLVNNCIVEGRNMQSIFDPNAAITVRNCYLKLTDQYFQVNMSNMSSSTWSMKPNLWENGVPYYWFKL
jgi:hypothetical protein